MALFAALAVARVLPAGPNDALVDRASRIVWGAGDLGWIGAVWPPIPVGIAAIAGSSAVALALIGALCSGGLLQALAERMVLARQPWWLVALALVSIEATPAMAFLATADLGAFLALVLLAMAMSGFLRFVLYGRTEGGFQAGLLLGLATACDITAVVYAIVLAAAGPLLAHHRHRGQAGSTAATAAVIAFPALAAAACWAFLEWRFTGGAFRVIRDSGAFTFPTGVASAAVDAVQRLGWILLCSPLYLVAGFFLLRRSAIATVGYLLPLPGLALTLWLGLRPPTGLGVVLLGCLAVLALPVRPKLPAQLLLAAAIIAQWVLTITVTVAWDPTLGAWWSQLTG